MQIIVNSLWALFMKMQVSVSEATDCLRKMIGGESMGNWFENMEPMNIQEEADELRRRGGDGGEYGATTGRPRRMGWFDAVASRYGCRIQGATEVALTVLDVLGYLDELPVCVGYEIDGKVTKDFPTTASLKKAKPVYEVLPGWKTDIRGITEYDKLPENCRKYIEFIEKELGVEIVGDTKVKISLLEESVVSFWATVTISLYGIFSISEPSFLLSQYIPLNT